MREETVLTRYRRKHLGYVFQMYNLIPNLNVKENIEVGAYLNDRPLEINELLNTLGLYEHRHKLPSQLSGLLKKFCGCECRRVNLTDSGDGIKHCIFVRI